jgi:hypothetical protein
MDADEVGDDAAAVVDAAVVTTTGEGWLVPTSAAAPATEPTASVITATAA